MTWCAWLKRWHPEGIPWLGAVLYDLVTELPPEVRRRVRDRFGRFRATLLWLHSFEEPFLSPQDMTALVKGTRFSRPETWFVGALCCLGLRKS